MSKGSIAVKNWFSDKKRFADSYNGMVFQGEYVVRPEDLELIDSESSVLEEGKEEKVKDVQRYRDVVMRWKNGVYLAVLALEAQSMANYAMPVRNMMYDSLSYTEQIKELWRAMEKEEVKKTSPEEFLSKLRKRDKLVPVITQVFYYGEKTWDASLDLHGMINWEGVEELKEYVPNYHLNLVDMSRIEDTGLFRSDLKEITELLKCRDDKEKMLSYIKEHEGYFSRLDKETFYALETFLGAEKFKKIEIGKEEREGNVNMCKALDDLYNEGIEKGMAQGIAQGIEKGIRNLIEICCEFGRKKEEVKEQLMEKYAFSEEDAQEVVDRYWNKNELYISE